MLIINSNLLVLEYVALWIKPNVGALAKTESDLFTNLQSREDETKQIFLSRVCNDFD